MASINDLEKRLWDVADQLRANSSLPAQEYSRPVLGLIFLKYADHRFTEAEKVLAKVDVSGRRQQKKQVLKARIRSVLTCAP